MPEAIRRYQLTAAAGCGKTHEIASRASRIAANRDLILTHTHAGVDALRKKLGVLNVPSGGVSVDTIAGWSLRWALSYPALSGITSAPRTNAEWDATYQAAVKLISTGWFRQILRASYTRVLVDEYQDCTLQQHKIVRALAETLETTIFGDPLQGIFNFRQGESVDWDRDVLPEFEALPALTNPWRWHNRNEDLGRWLQVVRQQLLQRQPIDLTGAPLIWEEIQGIPLIRQVAVCLERGRVLGQSTVAIHAVNAQCHYIAGRLSGVYQCIEPIDATELIECATSIEQSTGVARVVALIEFAECCMTRVGTALARIKKGCAAGAYPRTSKSRLDPVHAALRTVESSDDLNDVAVALLLIQEIEGVVVFRREFFTEFIRAIRNLEPDVTLIQSLRNQRAQTSHLGRRLTRATVSTTLLVKGLEFDHAIVLDADSLSPKNLYVAITRGSRSLTIFSKSRILRPRYD